MATIQLRKTNVKQSATAYTWWPKKVSHYKIIKT